MTTDTPPVLVCVFNRPEVTRRMIDALRAAEVSTLYVAADGPRPGHPDDPERCARVRELFDTIEWPCEIHHLQRDSNLGLQTAMVSAVDWFFGHVEAGVVLEDDCLPAPEWFRFAGELLDRYADVPQVMHVSALNMRDDQQFTEDSYFFAEVGHIWGWATWRRAWRLYDADLEGWPAMRRERGPGDTALQRALGRKFASAYAGRKATWSRSWYFTIASADGLAVIPSVNLVENIGVGTDATHPGGRRHPLRRGVTKTMAFPLDHPAELTPNRDYERHLARYHARSYPDRVRERVRILLDAVRGSISGGRERPPSFRSPPTPAPDARPESAEPDANDSSDGDRA